MYLFLLELNAEIVDNEACADLHFSIVLICPHILVGMRKATIKFPRDLTNHS